jgi:hypothetical protein
MMLPEKVHEDLIYNGLAPEDINIRELDNAERAATNTPHAVQGYAIPYYDFHGRLKPYYRVRLFDYEVEYKSPKDTDNWIYYPKQFHLKMAGKKFLMIVESELEAALLVKYNIPAVALGGVSNWRDRVIMVSGDAALAQANNKLSIKIPAGESAGVVTEDFASPLAQGLEELIDYCVQHGIIICLCYPSDNAQGQCTTQIQKAAAIFGYELRFRGIAFERMKQFVLPQVVSHDFPGDRVSVCGYIVALGINKFKEGLLKVLENRRAFPLHPNVREYINRRMQNGQLKRKEAQAVALSVISDLDSRGMRLRSQDDSTYYFDKGSKKLVAADWGRPGQDQYDSPFMRYLYKEYGLGGADAKLNVWIGTQFAGEEPIEAVTPNRVFARQSTEDDCIYYQISDSEFVKVDADGITVIENGELNILFASDQVEPLNTKKLVEAFESQKEEPVTCWWANTLSQVRLKDKDKQRMLTALLYYMSPWLYRWRGMQLPIELIIGEAGSGKSTLSELRLSILTGRPILRNAPNDLRDWHASIANAGGLHITDNVQLLDKSLRQRLSDEVCRLITETEPFIEQRRLYTNAEQVRIPVNTVFAITAIQQPFQNADILQRAMILELDKSIDQTVDGVIRYDSSWKSKQLNKYGGGRESWVAHQLVVIHKFFQLVKTDWNPSYSAKHRLINYEQSLLLLGKVFGINVSWLPDFITQSTDRAVAEADWALEGLAEFANLWFKSRGDETFGSVTVAEWAEEHQDYKACDVLANSRKLGKYLKAHKSSIFNLTGIQESGTQNNKAVYKVTKKVRR